MDDLPLQKIQISGPALASLLQRFSSSPGDVDGLLFGRVALITPSSFSDDPAPATTVTSPALVATITSFLCSNNISTFYDSTGQLNVPTLQRLLLPSSLLIGWLRGRRKTPLRPSMRESSVSSSLSSKIMFSVPVDISAKSYTLAPSIFLLLTTPYHDQLIHTHEYKAYQFRLSTGSFEPKTLDVVNIGPAFRGHYGAFCPNSPFPALPCELRGLTSMGEYDKGDDETLKSMMKISKDQKQLDKLTEELDVRRLSRLIGPEAANYTVELEDLYKKMLRKLDGLAGLVEESSARVLGQENHNMRLRNSVADLE